MQPGVRQTLSVLELCGVDMRGLELCDGLLSIVWIRDPGEPSNFSAVDFVNALSVNLIIILVINESLGE